MQDHTGARAPSEAVNAPRNNPAPIRFTRDSPFYRDIKERVAAYFESTGRSPRDCPQMYLKSLIVFAWTVSSYGLLVFAATSWWQVALLSISLALSIAAVGFNIQHDGAHRAYSRHNWINRMMATGLDLVGGSSFVWKKKHNSLHHTYTNIADYDDDIQIGILGRFSPHQRRMALHRIQHFYMWALYGLLGIKWQLFDDFHHVAVGRINSHPFARPKNTDLAIFVTGKIIFLSFAFLIPMLLHPIWVSLAIYALVSCTVGVLISVVFQLAHVVEAADFPVPEHESGRIASDWAVHQVETTVDFSRKNFLVTWFLGGLNFQVEHHLFPKVCHIHYPRLSKLVEEVCTKHGVRYNDHGSLLAGVISHFRWLREMGRPNVCSAAANT